jgi:hypothetical protein
MAGIPLNTFRTTVKIVQPKSTYFQYGYPVVGDSRFLVYTAPPGTTGVILYAQVANIGTSTEQVSLWHFRPNQAPTVYTELITGLSVPVNDAAVVLGGKLVLETYDAIYISGTAPMVGDLSTLKLTMSILESANQ